VNDLHQECCRDTACSRSAGRRCRSTGFRTASSGRKSRRGQSAGDDGNAGRPELGAAGIVAHLRSVSDKGAAQIEPVNLSDIVGHVPQMLRRELERTQVAVRIDLPARELRVDADRIQIEQVMVNLSLPP